MKYWVWRSGDDVDWALAVFIMSWRLESRLVMLEISPCYHCLPSEHEARDLGPDESCQAGKLSQMMMDDEDWWGGGATDHPNLVIWLSNCINFWIQSSPMSCHCPGSVLVIFSWILKSFPQFHSEHSWDHKENIHCLRPWFRLVLYIIVPSFIQITAKHSPRSPALQGSPCIKNQSQRQPAFSSSNPRDICSDV